MWLPLLVLPWVDDRRRRLSRRCLTLHQSVPTIVRAMHRAFHGHGTERTEEGAAWKHGRPGKCNINQTKKRNGFRQTVAYQPTWYGLSIFLQLVCSANICEQAGPEPL